MREISREEGYSERTCPYEKYSDKHIGYVNGYIKGYRQGDKDSKLAPFVSPFGETGNVYIMEKEAEFTFRGEKVTAKYKYYHDENTGKEFTDADIDEDNQWSVFRAYCEKHGMESFRQLVFITWEDMEMIDSALEDVDGDMIMGDMSDKLSNEEYYKEVLSRYEAIRKIREKNRNDGRDSQANPGSERQTEN